MAIEQASQGAPWAVEYLDRGYNGGPPRRVLEVDDDGRVVITGEAVIDGKELTGNQSIVGDLDVTGDVSADTATIATSATINAEPVLAGAPFVTAVVVGEDASALPQAVALVGAAVGDKVIAAVNLTDSTNVAADFETTITVVDEIQQTGADHTGDAIMVILVRQ